MAAKTKEGNMKRQMISFDPAHEEALKKIARKKLGSENLSGLFRSLAVEALKAEGYEV